MKVVLDANVIVSALINTRGTPKQILNLWREEAFELLISKAILDEISRVLRYPQITALHKLAEPVIQTFLALLGEEGFVVEPVEKLHVSPDETDNRYIECAVAGGADYLVTGHKRHLLPIGAYQGIRIVSPAVFLAALQMDR
jgi:putative PIN family toxin of toxin-antitoxin system